MLVNHFLEGSAQLLPDKTALVFGNHRLTYAEIDAAANRFANYLLAQGIVRGDRVAIFMDNCAELVIAIFGTLKAGAVYTVVNGATMPERLVTVLNNCRAAALISQQRKARVLTEAVSLVPSLRTTIIAGGLPGDYLGFAAIGFAEALCSRSAVRPHVNNIDADLAAIIYTSGSTGLPKGAMSTHLNSRTIAQSVAEYLHNTADDVVLSVLPLSHVYGLYQLLVTFKVGGTLVLEDGFAFPYGVMQILQQERITGFAGVPTIYAKLIQTSELSSMTFPHLRYLTNAAAALPVSHIQRLRQVFPSAEIYSMYGQTECTRVCYLPPEQLDRRPDSVGIAIPNTEVFIVDEAGARVPPGVVGELIVRGSHVMRGYWDAPGETARALRPGPIPGELVLYTGDFFRMDDEGFLYFVSRKDDIIKVRGEKVSPIEVENVLCAIDGILEAAVIGVSDEALGEVVYAAVVLTAGASLSKRDILAHCVRHLEDFKVPKLVEFWDSLPKTSSGKVTKVEIREKVQCAASSAR